MKFSIISFVAVVALVVFSLAFTKEKDKNEWNSLLDQNLTKWSFYLGYNLKATYDGSVPLDEHGDSIPPVGYKNINNVFSVIKEDNDLVLKVTGEYYGCVFTKESFKNFRLRMKVKWGTKKWDARVGKLMDAGLLYYSQGPCGAEYWRAWMLSQEFQLMEGHFGDYWNIATSAIDIRAFPPEDVMSTTAGNNQPFLSVGEGTSRPGYCMRTADYSTPGNGWTEVELVCYEGKSLHIVNGHVVMVLSNSRSHENGADRPLIEGKIQLQSEGCEVYYKDIKIKTIDKMPAEFLAYFQ